MSLIFPGTQIPPAKGTNTYSDQIYIADQLRTQFSLLADTGQTNRVKYDHETLRVTSSSGKVTDFYRTINNHFQAIVRLPTSDYLVMSGGDSIKKHSHLLSMKMEGYHSASSMDTTSPMGSNVVIKDGWRKDKLESLYFIDNSGYWHAGGLSMMGEVMTVALESNKAARIVFLNFTDPSQPEYISEIVLDQINNKRIKAGSASTVKLKNGHYLTAVWSDSDSHGVRFDFFISSKKNDLCSRFIKCCTVLRDQIIGVDNTKPRLQSFQFIMQPGGELFIIGGDNKNRMGNSSNRIFLFQLQINEAKLLQDVKNGILDSDQIVAIQLGHRELQRGKKYYNFGSAPGFYVDAKGKLVVYCGFTWKRLNPVCLNICEFYPRVISGSKKITALKDAIIELYTEKNYTGRMLVLHGNRYQSIPDFNEVKIADSGDMKRKVQSIRIQLPTGKKAFFYEGVNYNNGNSASNELSIEGDGTVIGLQDLSDFNSLSNYPNGKVKLKQLKSMSQKIQSFELV